MSGSNCRHAELTWGTFWFDRDYVRWQKQTCLRCGEQVVSRG